MSYESLKKIFREIHSEPSGGTLSWGRIASSIALIAAIIWITKIVLFTHALPALDGAAGFIVAPYASNKITTAAQSFGK